jgi:hypothetical protein
MSTGPLKGGLGASSTVMDGLRASFCIESASELSYARELVEGRDRGSFFRPNRSRQPREILFLRLSGLSVAGVPEDINPFLCCSGMMV